MNALLICPSEHPGAAFFSRRSPLALVPVLGRTTLDHAMMDLANRGAKTVLVLATDRPEQIRAALCEGNPWGVQVEVIAESQELSVNEARAKYCHAGEDWLPEPHDVVSMNVSAWQKPAQWFDALMRKLDEAGREAVGMREFQPGIWISTTARVASTAKLQAPCWIGQHAWIADGAIIGPCSVIEQGACVDENAEVVGSFVGPATYVGGFVELRNAMAWGRSLLNLRNDSLTEVTDAFLLSDLAQRQRTRQSNLLGRAAALAGLALTSPVLIQAWLNAKRARQPLFRVWRAVRAPVRGDAASWEILTRRELNGVSGLWRRWPELWNIVRGEFTWVGNRPLAPEQAVELCSDFERLWLSVAPGLISLADVEGCGGDPFGDDARAHAAFYAARRSMRENLSLLRRFVRNTMRGATFVPAFHEPITQP